MKSNKMKDIILIINLEQIKRIFMNKLIAIKIKICFNRIKYIKIRNINCMETRIKINMILKYKTKDKKVDIHFYKYFHF